MRRIISNAMLLAVALALALSGAGCTAKAKKAYHLSRADRFYDAGQLGPAEIEYLNVLKYDSSNRQAFGRLGRIYYEEGRLQRALFFLTKGSELAPDDLELRLKMGFISSAVGQATQALAQANFVLSKRPQDDEGVQLLAETAVQPADIAAVRARIEALARTGDRAAFEVALGNLALREHDIAAAGASYKKAQTLDPKSAAAADGLAALAWAQGDLKQADAYFKSAADASPTNSPRRMVYVRFKIQTGDLAGARQVLTEMIQSPTHYVPASMALAEIALAEKKYDECASLLNQVLSLDPDNFDAMLFQGRLDLARNQPAQAVADLERMTRVYPQVPRVQYELGAAYYAVSDFGKAAASLNHALQLAPNYSDAALLLGQVQIRAGNAAQAIPVLEALRKRQPQLVQAQLLLADAFRMNNRVGDALSIYSALERSYPTNAQLPLLRGAALLQVPDTAGARKAFERTLELAPDLPMAVEQLVNLDLADKHFDAAKQRADAEVKKFPNDAQWRMLAARILLAAGKRDEAEAAVSQAITLEPHNHGAMLFLAQIYADAGQRDKALAKVNSVLENEPQNISGLMLLARLRSDDKDYAGAAEAYEKALKVDPQFSDAMNNLAYLDLTYLNNTDRGFELAQRARDLLPQNASAEDTLGWAWFKKGSYQTALALLRESAASQPDVAEIQFHYGMASYMAGDEATARTALQQALKPGSDYPGRDEGQRCLAILDIKPETADAAARAMLEKRVAEKGDDPVALSRLAAIYQRAGDTVKTTATYEALLQAAPKNLDAMIALTRIYAASNPKRAYELAKAANKLAPFNVDVSHALGRLAFQSGDFDLASSALQQALQNQPKEASLLFDYAQATYSIGKVAAAQTAFQNALSQNLAEPQAAQARRVLDLIRLATNPAQAAAEKSRIANVLKTEPNDVPALMAQAAACEAGGDLAGAEQAGEKALGIYPEFTPAQQVLARLYCGDPSKLDRAYTLATKAREALPDDATVAKTLGAILVQRGDNGRAVALLKQAAAKISSDPELFYYLGAAQLKLNQKTEGKANLQQALALKLSGPLADSAKRLLSELK